MQIRQYIEQFHLIFLEQLNRKVDKRFYILKGGCNLRFYFKSFRYSEDIDFDTQTISPTTLRKNVNGILESTALKNILQTAGISIANFSASKQTPTTQRWKIALEFSELSFNAHTKIEFSRRGKISGALFEAIDSSLTQSYHLPPIFLSHYDRASAILQKIDALAGRNITQARDIFDLYLLIDNKSIIAQHYPKTQIAKALENLHNVTYQDFQSQVITYLSIEYQKIYSSEEIWQQMISNVEHKLLGNNYATK
jgi:predicted nucleotidyltransferase component of viral defense system